MEVEIWESPNGQSPAGEFIESLEPKTKKKVLWILEQLKKSGTALLHTELLSKLTGYDNLYELRIFYNKQKYRLLGVIQQSKFWVLHGFNKKSPKIPLKEIRIAMNRSKEIELKNK